MRIACNRRRSRGRVAAAAWLLLAGSCEGPSDPAGSPPRSGAVSTADAAASAQPHHHERDPADAAPAERGQARSDENTLLARGEYLVRHVAGCMECHTPRLTIGKFDESRLLSGVRELIDLEPDDDRRGLLHSPNLTPDPETGLGQWSDDEIKHAFLHGQSRDGRVLHWMMPSWIYHNMHIDDVDAVVAFLRSIPEVRNEIPDPQPLGVEMTEPYHLPDHTIPHAEIDPFLPEYQRAERGRYLAAEAGLCVFCHSPPAEDPRVPVDVDRLFMGRRKMLPVRLGTESELDEDLRDGPLIETRNLTPHATGLGEWSATDIANALRLGVGRDGLPLCDPMPSTFGGSLLGLTEQDALDIASYLRSLAPRDSGVIAACCTACHGAADADAGAPSG